MRRLLKVVNLSLTLWQNSTLTSARLAWLREELVGQYSDVDGVEDIDATVRETFIHRMAAAMHVARNGLGILPDDVAEGHYLDVIAELEDYLGDDIPLLELAYLANELGQGRPRP